ncbi:DUF559 domain-containing protein [Georgenia yuyongxinii]|uniref:DUF559 domain-containing protein n=1 Tax=Georgenia yuyongxinii TaxID=2589797 RepID=A0A5B8C2D7_9MICO|nr:DUF559 domain-containing protein [Georgenia yuyongxinii]QDC24829.1 DUF559 domain-containing protein [Georgenia yuyongxinii]
MDIHALELAETQLRRRQVAGIFTARMAMQSGFTRGAVRHRLAKGWWKAVVGDGIADANLEIDVRRRVVAARLTYPHAVVIRRTAAMLHGFPVEDDGTTHIHLGSGRRDRSGLSVHDVRLERSDVTDLEGIAVTSRRRTVLDCLMRLDLQEAERLLAWVVTRELVAPSALLEAAERCTGRPHGVQLARLAQMAAVGAVNGGELALHELLRTARISGWSGDQKIYQHGRIIARVDVLFHEEKLVLELDGERFHDPAVDRARDLALGNLGYTVLRFTWSDVTERPLFVVRAVVDALERSRGVRR